jgi:hypothetical protein
MVETLLSPFDTWLPQSARINVQDYDSFLNIAAGYVIYKKEAQELLIGHCTGL